MTAPVSIVQLCRTNRVACHGDHASVESDVPQESPGTGRAMNTRHRRAVLAVRRGALRRCLASRQPSVRMLAPAEPRRWVLAGAG